MRTAYCILMLLLINFNYAAAQTGALKGRVLNANTGKPVENFQVKIPKAEKSTKTDSLGYYMISDLTPGTYAVSFSKANYGKHTVKKVVIKANQKTSRNISLTKSQKSKPDLKMSAQENAVHRPRYNQQPKGRKGHRTNPIRRDFNREAYDRIEANPFRRTKGKPVSTFSIDVDRASYANTRRYINNGELPPKDAVRIEELINYFNYEYPQPEGDKPFSVNTEIATCPWNNEHELLHVGLQGEEIPKKDIPASNLVFLVDVSGSMNRPEKLPLVKSSLRLLTEELREKDQITIVVYAGSSGIALEPTPGDQKDKINQAINELKAGGSTAGSKGIKLAYQKAQDNFMEDGNNRVMLATDGDFNVGVTSDGALTRLIEEKRDKGVFLSVLGYGMGNYQGSKMEKLSNTGNGNYAYIDSKLEAKKTLVNEFGGTVKTIAKDVKVQVEFNPAKLKAYRLIGYVNRQLDKKDFKDDSVDAGELGAGHSVTVLYEVIPNGANLEQDPGASRELRYQEKKVKESAYNTDEVGILRLRYKEPQGTASNLIEYPLYRNKAGNVSKDFYWASSVAMLGMEIRQSPYKGETSYQLIQETAKQGMGNDKSGYRQGFLDMLEQIKALKDSQH